MSDLYLIDRLLHLMVDHERGGWRELEDRFSATSMAITRLRVAMRNGEMKQIGAGLAEYLRTTESEEGDES